MCNILYLAQSRAIDEIRPGCSGHIQSFLKNVQGCCRTSLSNMFHCLTLLIEKKIYIYISVCSTLASIYVCHYSSSYQVPLQTAWVSLLENVSMNIEDCSEVPSRQFFKRLDQPHNLCLSLEGKCFSSYYLGDL